MQWPVWGGDGEMADWDVKLILHCGPRKAHFIIYFGVDKGRSLSAEKLQNF